MQKKVSKKAKSKHRRPNKVFICEDDEDGGDVSFPVTVTALREGHHGSHHPVIVLI